MFHRVMVAILVVVTSGLIAPLRAQSASDTAPPPDELEQCLGRIEHKLDLIAADPAYKSLFTSQDRDITGMQSWFTVAQKTIHNARQRRLKGEDLGADVADNFHGAVREYRMNVEALGAGETIGKTEAPKARAKESLLVTLTDVVKIANELPALREVSLTVPTAQATPVEAITYVRRHLKEISGLLANRTLTRVTTSGVEESRDLRAALDAVWECLDQLVDEDGDMVPQLGKNGKAVDPLAPFKTAMKEARVQADFYTKTYLPNARRDEHRRRAEAIQARLAADGFEKRFAAVKALHEVAKEPVVKG